MTTADAPLQTKTITVTYEKYGVYHFYASFCYSFGYRGKPGNEHNLELRKIWFGGSLIYDAAQGKPSNQWRLGFYYKDGTEDQISVTGTGGLGYRGQILLWFSNVDLGTAGAIPPVSAEFWDGDTLTVYDAVEAMAERAGYAVDDIDIDTSLAGIQLIGYILDSQASLETVLTDLAFLYNFTYTETRGGIEVSFGYDVSTRLFLTDVAVGAELAVISEGGDNQQIDVIARAADQQLPRSITATYFNYNHYYLPDTQTAFRRRDASASENDVSFAMPVVMTAAELRSRLFDGLARTWNEANAHSLRLPRKFIAVDPGTRISWESYGNSYTGTIVKATHNGDWSTSVSVTESNVDFVPSQVLAQEPNVEASYVNAQGVRYAVLDVPDWDATQTDDDYLNVRIAVGAADDALAWIGAQFDWRRQDDPQGWETPAVFGPTGEVGIGTLIEDGGASIKVNPRNTDPARWADADKLVIVGRPGNWELLTYTTAADDSHGNKVLSGLSRGLHGTDDWQSRHLPDDIVVFANDTVTVRYTVAEYRADTAFVYRVIPAFGDAVNDATETLWVPSGNSRRPYSPNNVAGKREFSGDIVLTWVRDDGRFGGEPDNLYSVDIFNHDWTQLLRRAQPVTQESYRYFIDNQITDGLSTVTNLNVLVYRLNASHVGRGFPGGGSIGLILSGLLAGRVGPVRGLVVNFRDLSPWRARIGRVRGPVGFLKVGLIVDPLHGRVGGVAGPRGNLRVSVFFGRVGPLRGPSGAIAEVLFPVVHHRGVRSEYGPDWVIGDTGPLVPDANLWDATAKARTKAGDLLVLHDVRYGNDGFFFPIDREANYGYWHTLGTLNNLATNFTWQRVYYAIVDNDVLAALETDGIYVIPESSFLMFIAAQLYVIHNVDVTDPIEDYTQNKSNTGTALQVLKSVTSDDANALILGLDYTLDPTGVPVPFTAPAGFALYPGVTATNDDNAVRTNNSQQPELAGIAQVKVAAGATGDKTMTFGMSKPYISAMLAIRYGLAPPSLVGIPHIVDYTDSGETTAGTIDVDIPTGFSGDELLIVVYRSGSSNGYTAVPGWTEIYNSFPGLSTVSLMWALRRNATGTEPATITITLSGSAGDHVRAICIRVRDGQYDAVQGTYHDNNGTSIDLTEVTTTQPNDLILGIAAGSVADDEIVNGSDMETVEAFSTGNPAMILAKETLSAAGPSGGKHFTISGAQHRGGVLVAYKYHLNSMRGEVGPVVGPHAHLTLPALLSGSVGPVVGPFGDLTVTAGGHRYWRIKFNASNGDAGIETYIIEFLTGGVNQATTSTGTASASSHFPGEDPINTISPNGGNWASNFDGNFSNLWFEFDFGSGFALVIDGLRMAFATNGRSPSNFDVQWSDNNSTWTTDWSKTSVPASSLTTVQFDK